MRARVLNSEPSHFNGEKRHSGVNAEKPEGSDEAAIVREMPRYERDSGIQQFAQATGTLNLAANGGGKQAKIGG